METRGDFKHLEKKIEARKLNNYKVIISLGLKK